MTGIKIEDIAFVGFSAPDLDKMQTFMEDFGAVVAAKTDTHLFMRGAGESPFVHVTERGEPGFAMIGLRARSLDDLKQLADEHGETLADLDAPGGGSYIDLIDPDGNTVRVIAGYEPAQPLPLDAPQAWNNASDKPRMGTTKRTDQEPPMIVRLGHCVLSVGDFRASEEWYKSRFGFITSDEIEAAPGMALGAFMRCDRGDQPTDHHTMFIAQMPTGPGFNHAAFEVRDVEDVLKGHSQLAQKGYDLAWGVGRHFLGSQVFDYWRDPWGHTVEHWTDGDMFTAADGSNKAGLAEALGVQWGPQMPPNF